MSPEPSRCLASHSGDPLAEKQEERLGEWSEAERQLWADSASPWQSPGPSEDFRPLACRAGWPRRLASPRRGSGDDVGAAVGSKTKLPSSYALDNKAKGSLSQTRDLHFRRSPCLKKGADVSDGGVRSSASGWAAATESPRAPRITRCARALCRPPTVPSVALVMLNAPLPKITRILRG